MPTIGASTRAARSQMQNVVNNMNRFVAHMGDQMPEILREALEPTFDKSQRYVPIDTGVLKDSGYLVVVKRPSGAAAEIGYSKDGHPYYGIFVHENLEAHHKSPTRAKFLQAALEEDESAIQRRILDAVKQASGI
jgi:hypothetical protein